MTAVVHWDDVEASRSSQGSLRSSWSNLGRAAGSVDVGVNRIQVEPNARSTPLHMEGEEEEIFFVLGGSGVSWQLGEDGEATYEVRPGDCLVHRAGAEAHSLVAGDEGLDVLAFGLRARPELAFFPRLRGGRIGPLWADELETHQFTQEAALGDPELPAPSVRPRRIVAVDDVEPQQFGPSGRTVSAVRRDLARAAGSLRTGLKHVAVEDGKLACPPHCHSAEEEIFVVLDGEGVCILGDEEHPVRRGHIVARPPGTGVAHTFRGGHTLAYLAYGTREPNDIAYYPRSNKVSFRGVGAVVRLDRLDYWDGED
jgi:uncharacterized cupin superfamily protein